MGRAGGGGRAGGSSFRSMGGGMSRSTGSSFRSSSRSSSSSRNMGSSVRSGLSSTSKPSSSHVSRPVTPTRPPVHPRPYTPPIIHRPVHNTVIIKERNYGYSEPSRTYESNQNVSSNTGGNNFGGFGGNFGAYSEEDKLNINIEHSENKRSSSLRNSIIFMILAVLSLILMGSARNGSKTGYPLNLSGTIDVGYVHDFQFFENSTLTSQACDYFKEKTGISLVVYAMLDSGLASEDADEHTKDLYDTIAKDENHAILAYYNDIDYWSWASGDNVRNVMTDAAWNRMIDRIYDNWYNEGLTNDEVFSKGIIKYTDSLTSTSGSDALVAMFLTSSIIFGLLAVSKVIVVFSEKSKIANYKEQLSAIQTEKILNTDLDKFGDKDLEDTMKKYEE